MTPRWRVGIDIGGTFTDVVAMEGESGRAIVVKVPSTPADPAEAIMNGLDKLATDPGQVQPADVQFFAHGTTVATNALIEQKGAQTGLMITKGFNAIYEMRGGTRPSGSDMIDLYYQKPILLAPPKNTFQVPERLRFDGSVERPLDEDAVRQAVAHFRRRGIRSVAVCFLFSFMNPIHERRVQEIFEEEYPECRMTLSSTVLPVIREYQRLSTTVLDAYVGPIVEKYLQTLTARLRDAGLRSPQVYIMQSGGGLMRIDVAAEHPNEMLLSGPAAGVAFSAVIGKNTGQENLVTFDMGGTSADISLLVAGRYSETRLGKVDGQDLGTPMIDIRTVSAGGGTVAWRGAGDLLKVGPQSAGAVPGPVAYGRGGTQPTVTDANLVLGLLNPTTMIGGDLPVDRSAAERAVGSLAESLGLSLQAGAQGIHRIINVAMERELRLSLAERGLDPRKFALLAFGGSGPVHAAEVAHSVEIPRIIVPMHPGISCAMGLLQTNIVHSYVRSRILPLAASSADKLRELFDALEARALEEAKAEDLDPKSVLLQRQVDVRYRSQGFELTVPYEGREINSETLAQTRKAYDERHHETYGIAAPKADAELTNARVVMTAPIPHLELPGIPRGGLSPTAAQTGQRMVLFQQQNHTVPTRVYNRDLLLAGNEIAGPAIVEQMDSTTVIPPGFSASVDDFGNIHITVPRAAQPE
jgi:N-methylhydantoinase A